MIKKILFIDDEATLCKKVAKFLTLKGFQVTTVTGGKEGIELLKKESFSLIISDLIMPQVDGLEVLKYIKKNAPQSLTIILTGYSTIESTIEALKENVYDYILKPFDCNHLLITINRAFEVLILKKANEKAEKKLKELTITDSVTGLFNRHYFYSILSNEIKRSKRYKKKLSLMVLELENFGEYKDNFGQLLSDKYLKKFAAILKNCTREMDFCFRYGKNDFAAILPETELTDALIVAERIRTNSEKSKLLLPMLNDLTKSQGISISIGLTDYKKGSSIKNIIKDSDEMLFKAKNTGKNMIYFEDNKKRQVNKIQIKNK